MDGWRIVRQPLTFPDYGSFARNMCQTRSHYALAFPMIRVLVTVADRLCASAGPLCVSRGQEQDGSEALEIEQRLPA